MCKAQIMKLGGSNGDQFRVRRTSLYEKLAQLNFVPIKQDSVDFISSVREISIDFIFQSYGGFLSWGSREYR